MGPLVQRTTSKSACKARKRLKRERVFVAAPYEHCIATHIALIQPFGYGCIGQTNSA